MEICGYNRFRFLLQSLTDLENKFASFGINFMCFYGEPHEVLEKIIKVNSILIQINCLLLLLFFVKKK